MSLVYITHHNENIFNVEREPDPIPYLLLRENGEYLANRELPTSLAPTHSLRDREEGSALSQDVARPSGFGV